MEIRDSYKLGLAVGNIWVLENISGEMKFAAVALSIYFLSNWLSSVFTKPNHSPPVLGVAAVQSASVDIDWTYGMTENEVCVAPGKNIIFQTTGKV